MGFYGLNLKVNQILYVVGPSEMHNIGESEVKYSIGEL